MSDPETRWRCDSCSRSMRVVDINPIGWTEQTVMGVTYHACHDLRCRDWLSRTYTALAEAYKTRVSKL